MFDLEQSINNRVENQQMAKEQVEEIAEEEEESPAAGKIQVTLRLNDLVNAEVVGQRGKGTGKSLVLTTTKGNKFRLNAEDDKALIKLQDIFKSVIPAGAKSEAVKSQNIIL